MCNTARFVHTFVVIFVKTLWIHWHVGSNIGLTRKLLTFPSASELLSLLLKDAAQINMPSFPITSVSMVMLAFSPKLCCLLKNDIPIQLTFNHNYVLVMIVISRWIMFWWNLFVDWLRDVSGRMARIQDPQDPSLTLSKKSNLVQVGERSCVRFKIVNTIKPNHPFLTLTMCLQ